MGEITSLAPVNWDAPEEILEDGRRVFRSRCRIPMQFDMGNAEINVVTRAEQVEKVIRDASEDVTGSVTNQLAVVIEAIASSTSVDFYGTEMSAEALQRMATQFASRVAFVPTHRDSEWMDVIGHTTEGGVVPSDVEKPAERDEQGFVLRVRIRLDMRQEMSKRLMERVENGEQIGTSIGGWFTELRFITSEGGEIERVIVEDVDLDHLAATRAPANPDSWISKLRRMLDDELSRAIEAAAVTEDEEDETYEASIEEAPAYRPSDDMVRACSTCLFFHGSERDDEEIGLCTLFDFRTKRARATYVCDSWEARTDEVAAIDEVLNTAPHVTQPEMRSKCEDCIAEGPAELTDTEEEEAPSPLRSEEAPEEESGLRTSPDSESEAEGADPTPETTNTGDDEMDKEQAALLLTTLTALSVQVETLNERVASLGAPPDEGGGEPDPEPAEDFSARVAELQAERDTLQAEADDARQKAERAEATVHRLATMPVRRAHAASAMTPPTGPAAMSHWSALGNEAGGALGAIFGDEKFTRNLEGEYGYPELRDPGVTRRMLKNELSIVLNAAEADGVLVDPASKSPTNWS